MQELAFATDSQLRSIARQKAAGDYANSPKRKVEFNFATALPVVDSFMVGAATNGTLKKKVLAGGSQLKDWGIFLAVVHFYNKAINKIVEKSETLQNFKENSPFTFGVVNTVLGLTAGISGIRYINAGYRKFVAPYIPKCVKEFGKSVVNATDNSSVGKSINEGMKTFAQKYPNITKVFGATAKWALPLLCLGFIASMAIDAVKAKSNEDKTYKQLEAARLAAAQELASKNEE